MSRCNRFASVDVEMYLDLSMVNYSAFCYFSTLGHMVKKKITTLLKDLPFVPTCDIKEDKCVAPLILLVAPRFKENYVVFSKKKNKRKLCGGKSLAKKKKKSLNKNELGSPYPQSKIIIIKDNSSSNN